MVLSMLLKGRFKLEGEYVKRLKWGLAALLMIVAAGVFTAVAGAAANSGLPAGALNPTQEQEIFGWPQIGNGFDPQNTNIPSLAWRGEQLRFVKCNDEFTLEGQTANFSVADFSGDAGHQPTVVPGSIHFFSNHNDNNCVRGDYYSTKPGLARIKLKVTDDSTGDDVVVHEFLAGWMAIGSAALDPTGSVSEPAGDQISNNVSVQVRGAIPLDREWQLDWNLAGSACPANVDLTTIPGGVCLTLPDDWATLAHAIASISTDQRTANPGVAPWQYWDIHDSSAPAALGVTDTPDTHVSQTFCPLSAPSTTTDQVDNCQGGGEFGIFSRVFGDGTANTVGPFDPQYPEWTLLSDGLLNAADAPMPPLRINFSSNGNTGFFDSASPTSVDKHVLYSVDGLGTPDPHNLYAPYYGAYIPATSRAWDSSGTDAPADETGGNNFEGYLLYGQYHFWDIASVLTDAVGVDTSCLLGLHQDEDGPYPELRETNSGPQSVAVYTDEHGQAMAEWIPGLNNDNFLALSTDENFGCDLEGVDLGGATITATAQYPNQNVAAPSPVSGELVKQIQNLFKKSVSCKLKSNQNPARTAGEVYICTASAQDIDSSGARFNGEYVCISREPFGTMYGNDITGQLPPNFSWPGEACVILSGGTDPTATEPGKPATAVVETPATLNGTLLDISAFFTDELLWRDTCVTVGVSYQPGGSPSGPCGAVTIPPPSNPVVPVPEVVRVVSPANVSSTLSQTSANQANQTGHSAKVIKAAVASVKVVSTRNGRVLVVKVTSPNKTATVRIVLVGKNGRVLVKTVRTIKANKSVRVSHLLVPKNVKAIHVNVLR